MSNFDGSFSVGDAGNAGDPSVTPSVTDTSPDSLASPFLANIPETDREIVGRYVKDWDAGVTRRFQEIRDEYRPYKDLGASPDVLRSAYQLYQMADTDPQTVLELLQEYIQENQVSNTEETDVLTQIISGPATQPAAPELEDNPFAQQLNAIQENQKRMAELMQQQQAQAQAQAEQAAIDNMLGALHNKHGEFNDQWVLVEISRGVDPETAVSNYNKFADDLVSSRTKKPAVPVLPGAGGGSPIGQVDKNALKDPTTRQKLVADILAASAANR